MTTLDEIEARARRHLDGMTINRDAMAYDVLRLCKALRDARAAAQKANEQRDRMHKNTGIHSGVIDDIFGPIFGAR